MSETPMTPEREQELRKSAAEFGALRELLAEVDRLRAEVAARPSRAAVVRAEATWLLRACPDGGLEEPLDLCHCETAALLFDRAEAAEAGETS